MRQYAGTKSTSEVLGGIQVPTNGAPIITSANSRRVDIYRLKALHIANLLSVIITPGEARRTSVYFRVFSQMRGVIAAADAKPRPGQHAFATQVSIFLSADQQKFRATSDGTLGPGALSAPKAHCG